MRKRPEPSLPHVGAGPLLPGLAAWQQRGPTCGGRGPWGTGRGHGGQGGAVGAGPWGRGLAPPRFASGQRLLGLLMLIRAVQIPRLLENVCTFTEASFRCVYSPCRIEDIPPPTKKLSPELTPSVLFTGFEPVQVQQYVKVTCQPRVACFLLAVTEPTPDGGACRDRLRGAVVTCLGRRRVSCPQVTRFLAVAE